MRLFLALDIDDAVRERLSLFIAGVSGFALDARWARPESLHVTLKFIGEQPEAAVEKINQALATISSSTSEIHFRGYGFFPTAKSPRVFWIGLQAVPPLAALAAAIDHNLASLGIPKERQPFSPHLTLARGSGASRSPRSRSPGKSEVDAPHGIFQRLQEKLAALPTPEFGTLTPNQFFLYQSQLSPKGSKYTKLSAFDLK
jgi:2'-5' RNA ligase